MTLWQCRPWPGRPFLPSFPFAGISTLFSLVHREFSASVGTTDKVHPPYRSKEEAGAFACSMLLVLPSGAIPILRQAELGPDLPASFDGATSLENSSQPGREEFFNDPMLSRLIHRSLVGNRELKILAQDVKDEADEPVSKLVEHEAEEARYCDRDRLRLPAGSAVLYPPLRNPKPGPGLPESFDLRQADPQSDLPEVFDERPARKTQPSSGSKSSYDDPMLLNLDRTRHWSATRS